MAAKLGLVRDARRTSAAEMKYMRRTAWYTWTDHKTNTQIAKELKITTILYKLLEYKRNWIQHVNRMSRNRLPRVIKHYTPTGRRNHDRPLKRLLDTWDRNGSTSGPTPWQIYDDDYGGGGSKQEGTESRHVCNPKMKTKRGVVNTAETATNLY
jgi:Holliday junction resolvase RusA-like endonuclease